MQTSTPTSVAAPLSHRDFPAIYRAADTISLRYQRQYTWEVRWELLLLIVGATAGVGTAQATINGTRVDWAAALAVIAFLMGFSLQLAQIIQQPSRYWYAGRAVAESVKTVTWRYAVGGKPFIRAESNTPETDVQRSETEQLLQQKLIDILTEQAKQTPLDLKPDRAEITPAMRELREQPLDIRRSMYEAGRLRNQQQWYANRARENDIRVKLWSALLLFLELAAAVAALLKAINIIQIDLLGIFGTVIAAVMTWLQLRQHQNLAQAYSVAALELQTILNTINDQQTEAAWAVYVNDAEEAISREHTLWVSRQTVTLADT
jgi:hypothetical protein